MTQRNADNMCRCRSCGEVLNRSDAITVKEEHYGIMINVKACPFCKSTKIRALSLPKWTERLIKTKQYEY